MIRKIINTLKRIKRVFLNYLVKRKASSVGKDLRVNYYSKVNRNTKLGNNVNFNGMDRLH